MEFWKAVQSSWKRASGAAPSSRHFLRTEWSALLKSDAYLRGEGRAAGCGRRPQTEGPQETQFRQRSRRCPQPARGTGGLLRAGSRERGVKFYSIEHVADTLSTGEPRPRPMPPVSRRHVPDGRSGRAGRRPRKPLTAHGHDRRWSRGPRDSQDHSAPRLPSKQHSAR